MTELKPIKLKVPKQRNQLVPLALARKAGKHKDRKREDKHAHFWTASF